jgi:nicotinamidase-related amidase
MRSSIELTAWHQPILVSTTAFEQTPNKKVLLVIDVQENLLDSNSRIHVVPGSIPSFIQNLNKSIEFFERNNMPVIYIVNEWINPILNMLTGNVCKKGARGTGIDKRVRLVNEMVYKKSKMNALNNKEISKFLKENSISELYIAGLFAEACIKETVKGAIKYDYNVILIEDAVGSRSDSQKSKSVSFCKDKGTTVITANQLGRTYSFIVEQGRRS